MSLHNSSLKINFIIKWFILLIISLIIASLSITISPDFKAYTLIVDQINSLNIKDITIVEYGFVFIIYWLKLLFTNTGIILFIISFCSLFSKVILLNKILKNNKIALFLYIILFSFFIDAITLRAGISISFAILAYIFFCKQLKMLTLLSLIMSIIFHNSAYIYLPVFFLLQITKKHLNILTIGLLLISLCLIIFKFDITDFINYFNFSDESKLIFYFKDEGNSKNRSLLSYAYFILFFLMTYLSYLFIKKKKFILKRRLKLFNINNQILFEKNYIDDYKKITYDQTALFLSAFALFIYSIFIFFNSTIANRMSDLFLIFICIPFSRTLQTKNIFIKIIVLTLLLIYGLIRFYYLYYVISE